MLRELTDEDMELLHEMWAGALFDLIHAAMTKRPNWSKDDQDALVYVAIAALAERYGIIERDEDDEP